MQAHRVTYRLGNQWKAHYYAHFHHAYETFMLQASRGIRTQYVLGSMDECEQNAPNAHMMR